MAFAPTLESLAGHRVPAWYDDAKFGIFIHWGLFSVPAFAARAESVAAAFRDHYDRAITLTPYTEWYWNAIRVPESESARHHREVWHDAPYENFREPFLNSLKLWDPEGWADLFADAGARYVVLVAKHHDGFCLWPSAAANPHQRDWASPRDIAGELAAAVRARGLKFGVYYSGGIDWTFNRAPLRTLGEFLGSTPGGDYPAYAEAQMRELMARYDPDILWNDISWPSPPGPLMRLFADYYNARQDGVVNDRWMPLTLRMRLLRWKFVQRLLDAAIEKRLKKGEGGNGIVPPPPPHYDFRTPEYTTFDSIQSRKWETTRGMSASFGFNRRDTDADYQSVEELVRGFIDAVAKNGNLLLNVGPRGVDAQIPPEQIARLKGFGQWLRANAEAVYGTRPWTRAEGRTDQGGEVRFVSKNGAVYAHVWPTPSGDFAIEGAPSAASATHVASGTRLSCAATPAGLRIALPRPLGPAPVHAFKLT